MELHMFSNIVKDDQEQTEIIDEIEFENPYGRIGKLFEGYAYSRLQKLYIRSIIEQKLPVEL
jgi:ligand-binding SRPBCC domain-containing protein